DPTRPRLLSQYVTSGGASQEAVPTPDGKWLFLNLQRNPGPTELVADPERGTGYGIQVIDISDKENPRFESFFPVEIRGSHTVFYREIGGVPYVFLTAQPSRQGVPTGEVYTTPVGNEVVIARFSEVGGRHVLQRVSEYRYAGSLTATTSQGCFPHDMWVETHPKTRQEILYVAYWDCGAITVDVSDPLRPVELDVYADLAPSTVNRIHYFRPDPVLRDGRVIAYSGPEIDQSPGEPGYLRVYDVTDPADIRQIGHWRLPGEVENDMAFIFSPHNFEFHGDLLAFAHYHAGFWVLDISEPEAPAALGFYMPTGVEGAPFDRPVWKKEPNFPIAYLPNAYDARWYGDYIVGSERGTGLYIMEHTGPHP
ncbi:MAG: LVIVD repeat-containing protein, partial [Methanobacteriota archaeon]